MALTVAQAFDQFKSRLELNQSFQDAVTTHHNAIRSWIESYSTNIKTQLIGSLQRKTRIPPRPNGDTFDIDILIVLGSFARWVPFVGISPTLALKEVEHIVAQNETYERMGPETDSPAIIVEYQDDIKIELIPAYVDQVGYAPNGTPTPPVGRGYWIPKNNRWVLADYDYDAYYISEANKGIGGYLIPTIKMLKSAKRNLFQDMKSYHLELLATSIIPHTIKYFKEQRWQISYPWLVYYFFLVCKDEILKEVNIPGSKSSPADGYMTLVRKQEISRLFNKIASHCKTTFSINDKDAIPAWNKLFSVPFPSGT